MAMLNKTHIFRQEKPLEQLLRFAPSITVQIHNCSFINTIVPLRRRRFSSIISPMSSSSDASSDSKTVRVEIKGRVQGVFYRDWTVENAKELGLKGWVRNRRDGSVEALFSGRSEKVDEMEQRCRRGPTEAMVTGLRVFPCTDDPGNSFEQQTKEEYGFKQMGILPIPRRYFDFFYLFEVAEKA